MRGMLAAALLVMSAPAFAQTGGAYGVGRGAYSVARPGDESLTCQQLQSEYDAAVSDAAMHQEYSGGGDEGEGEGSGGGSSLGSLGAMATGAMGAMGGGGMGGMGGGAGVGMSTAMSMMSGGPQGGAEAQESGKSHSGRRSWAMARPDRIRSLARQKNCGLIQRSAGWERRAPPPLPPSAPLDASPEALDGAAPPDDAGAPAPDTD